MVNIQKQYYPETNVHGVILETGKKGERDPGLTSLHYLNRAWDMQSIHALKKMMVDCAEAAARCTTAFADATQKPLGRLSDVVQRLWF